MLKHGFPLGGLSSHLCHPLVASTVSPAPFQRDQRVQLRFLGIVHPGDLAAGVMACRWKDTRCKDKRCKGKRCKYKRCKDTQCKDTQCKGTQCKDKRCKETRYKDTPHAANTTLCKTATNTNECDLQPLMQVIGGGR